MTKPSDKPHRPHFRDMGSRKARRRFVAAGLVGCEGWWVFRNGRWFVPATDWVVLRSRQTTSLARAQQIAEDEAYWLALDC